MFIRGDAPEMRDARDLAERVKGALDVEVEELDVEEREGKDVAEVYDIYATPSFLVTTDDGVVIHQWIGKIPAEFELKGAVNL
ncbi:hypothetical protein C4544_02695 [candidate division WS5 bacterium]|uniref:Thioredoxin-like fold domain-containing protein n=1 Tax=candidate division WS5 bacterium TaxID=2093353 RepID=A0A419DE99_9BACT|nr:MAG: hypothetical protein C4544_02695 [candidate division WS5 bacterium]